jgi:hypothetical protein
MRQTLEQRGQSLVMVVIALVALLGMGALVLDVGAWYHAQRELQASADAAALAGAQALPDDPPGAQSLALSYSSQNGGGVSGDDIDFSTKYLDADTISVTAQRPMPGFLARVLGIDSVQIKAHATARAELPTEARYVAPMVVSWKHPLLSGSGCPCFGQQTTLNYDPMGAPGAFGMLNLDGKPGNPGTSDEAYWIAHGYDKYLGLGDYYSDPGAKFSGNEIQDALASRVGTELLFPVYRVLKYQGSNATYEIIGWVGFLLEDFQVHGNNSTLTGEFVEYIANGITSESPPPGEQYFGVRTISLVN